MKKESAPKKSLFNREESFGISKDLSMGWPIQTMWGNQELLVENYRGLLIYTSERILIQAKNMRIRVEGRNLLISYYTNDEMKIKGFINQIIYE